ncbi:flagellar basal-body rod protein FlgF [Undibacterium flavidum]|uniref:Flagellar basal-body rod protein FlgF n=1 Tax=Undibacterium flavidum TaxID=2762297 RepID=A0ABR6YEQ9_9BURK|nr:flagellar basal-body rod protein FlgF [Undibacterium flavidum]MBC3875055.1 flagellar basal-body rod protein FlgF [Undibacterium flavidum]
MLDSIYIAMSGLQGYSKGLRVIANNTANINTPGFKSSSLQFGDLFYSNNGAPNNNFGQVGHGLSYGSTALNFKQGELRQTGNSLDLAVDGQGLFTLKDAEGKLHYTRAGQFEFNSDGILVNRSDGFKVMGQDSDGNMTEISLSGKRTSEGKQTSEIKFSGSLLTTNTTQNVTGVKVMDKAGGEHTLGIKFTNTNATTAGSWAVEVSEGTTVIGTGQIIFSNGQIVPANSKVQMNYTPAGLTAMPLSFDFSANVTATASSSLSLLAFASQNGYGPGALAGASFDALGTLSLSYSNGQTVQGSRLSLAQFESLDSVAARGNNEFDAVNPADWHTGVAGKSNFGSVKSGMVEISNVDLSQEFSDLIIMQRGYQGSSQIISTANEMLQELFSMKGK